jgi:hypothetical protein
MRGTSIYSYLIALSCADAIVLWFSCFKVWIRLVADFEFLHISPAACKIGTFFYLFSTYLSSWLIVAMTADRFTAVWFPLKASSLCSVTHARIIILSLSLLAVVSSVHVFWTYDHSNELKCQFIVLDEEKDAYKFYIFEYAKLAAYCFVPFVIVLSLNAAIIYKLKWGSQFLRRQDTSTSTVEGGSYDRIVYMLLTISFTWFVLTLPVSLLGFVDFLHNNKIARTMCFVLMYTNHSINFYLYCLTGRKFRQELRDVFNCRVQSCGGKLRLQNGTETTRTSINEKIPLTAMSSNRPAHV